MSIDFRSLFESFTMPILILAISFAFAWVFNSLFEKFLNKKAKDANHDPTNYRFLRHVVSAIIYIIGFSLAIYSIPALKALALSLLAGAGIMAVAVGFASQSALSNIVSGLFIVIYKPFGVKDRIEVKGMYGVVEDITLRHTVIRNYENKRIVIPNAQISNEVIINADLVEEKVCKLIDFSISYGSDIDLAKAIIEEEGMKHPLCIDNRENDPIKGNDKQVVVRVINLGDSSVDLMVWIWAESQPNGFIMKCELLESVKKRFDKEGIVIPFPHRTVYQKQM
jgi:small conductance mechanosensitive channel